MRARFQVIVEGVKTLDTELQVRNRFAALHELLRLHEVPYDPEQFLEKSGWVQFTAGNCVYRTSTKFG